VDATWLTLRAEYEITLHHGGQSERPGHAGTAIFRDSSGLHQYVNHSLQLNFFPYRDDISVSKLKRAYLGPSPWLT
jgi:hypothetical protein